MKKKEANRYNNPLLSYLIINAFVNTGIFYFVVGLFPLSNHTPLTKYTWPFYGYLVVWLFFGVAFKKYLDYRKRTLSDVIRSCFKADFIAFLVGALSLLLLSGYNYSFLVLLTLTLFFVLADLFLVSVYYAFHEAVIVDLSQVMSDVLPSDNEPRDVHPVDEEVRDVMSSYIEQNQGKPLLDFLKQNAELFLSSSLLINTTERLNIEKVSKSRYTTIINLQIINNIRDINAFLRVINERLPSEGVFVGCFESKSQRKRRIIGKEKSIWGLMLYFNDFILRRVMPKLNITREAYFWLTNGKDRVLSKAEMYGRVYFSGFEVIKEVKINGWSYFIAKKIKEPLRLEMLNYGLVISLPRVGKDGKIINVYKLRTMHPYSEYLQGYIYAKNKLRQGGKFQHDFRVTTMGRFFRRYWLDELPMLANMLKGNMKLVGVRPLSKHYFSLYSIELQKQRIRHKPGLLPPFYADMPTTLDEIQASEKRYLDACEKNGTLITDIRYLFRIIYNIIFKKVRSK